ncbi:platelet glycoprotein V-like [Bacillus rossius redtenbacheri]|uniref:platelet glycoprotein V-like n=1 Tax=Bacillus rossius redtenbacheri TaxID=93214 RepID=UPI002FDD8FF8
MSQVFSGLEALVVLVVLASCGVSCPTSCDCPSISEAVCYSNPAPGRLPSGLPTGITSLVLGHANLSYLANDTMSAVRTLQRLELRDVRLKWVQAGAFHALASLQTLGLQDNFLDYLEPNMFLDNPRLWFLDLSGNDLHVANNSVFLISLSLRELNASRCRLDYLPDQAFQGLLELRVLHLEGNYLHFLHMRMLSPLLQLTHIYLQDNRINSLRNTPAASPAPLLSHMDLSGNLLTTVNTDAVGVAGALRQLLMLRNPLVCDCRLAPARSWLEARGIEAPGHCAAPLHLVGVDWRGVHEPACSTGALTPGHSRPPAALASAEQGLAQSAAVLACFSVLLLV